MPYVITTLTPNPDDIAAGCSMVSTHESRRTVATLQEAREYAYIVASEAGSALLFGDMPEAGGTFGPLPDGTVIEVEQADWERLAKLGEADTDDHDVIIDASNAQQGVNA